MNITHEAWRANIAKRMSGQDGPCVNMGTGARYCANGSVRLPAGTLKCGWCVIIEDWHAKGGDPDITPSFLRSERDL
jgi:hypothetical protein